MAYKKKTWINRDSEFINRRQLTPVNGGMPTSYLINRDEGIVYEEGDAFNAATLNDLEERVESGFAEKADLAGAEFSGEVSVPAITAETIYVNSDGVTQPCFLRGTDVRIDFNFSSVLYRNMILGYVPINNSYCLCPSHNAQLALGGPKCMWSTCYVSSGTVSSSDRTQKNSIEELDGELAARFMLGLKPASYRYNNGESGRRHYGMIAQDVEELMRELGVESRDFAGFIKSPVYEEDEEGNAVLDEQGKPVETDDYTYGLRYEEFIAPLISLCQTQQSQIDDLTRRLEALESKLN